MTRKVRNAQSLKSRRVKTGWTMAAKEARNRIATILFSLVPRLFHALIVLTTADRLLAFKLALVPEETIFEVSERKEAIVFFY